MHGAGNDFVVVDAPLLSPARIAALANRRTGIGCDQFITLETAQPPADILMRIHNPDGSESATCGNATRCVAALLHERTGRRAFIIQTKAGLLAAEITAEGIAVDMGAPGLDWRDIPLAREADTLHLPIDADAASASMGNPHATLFVEDTRQAGTIGPIVQANPLFAAPPNVGFAQILSRRAIRLRVFERGAGLTLACGSGACAALVNAARRGLTGRAARLVLDGGTLEIAWRESDGHVIMTGPAVTSFHGTVDLSTTAP